MSPKPPKLELQTEEGAAAHTPTGPTYADDRFLHGDRIQATLILPDGCVASLAGTDLYLWDAGGRRLDRIALLDRPAGDSVRLALHGPSRLLLAYPTYSAPAVRDISIVDTSGESLEVVADVPSPLHTEEHTGRPRHVEMQLRGDTIRIATSTALLELDWREDEVTRLLDNPLEGARHCAVALDVDGARVAFADPDSDALVALDAQSGEVLARPDYETADLEKASPAIAPPMAWSPDGRQLATARRRIYRTVVEIWDIETGARISELEERPSRGLATSLQYAPDGSKLLVTFDDSAVTCWNLEDGRIALELTRLRRLSHATFSPDGGSLARTAARRIYFHDADDGAQLARYGGVDGAPRRLDYEPTTATLLVGDRTQLACLDEETAAPRDIRWGRDVSIRPPGTDILLDVPRTGRSGSSFALYDCTRRLARPLFDHRVETSQLGSDAIYLADARGMESPKLRALSRTGTPLGILDERGGHLLALSPNEERLAVADGADLRILDLPGTSVVWRRPDAHAGELRALTFSADGTSLFSADDTVVRAWSLEDATLEDTTITQVAPLIEVALDGACRALRTLDERRVAVVSSTGTVGVLDLGDEAPPSLASVTSIADDDLALAHLAEGGILFTLGPDASIERYDLADALGIAPEEARKWRGDRPPLPGPFLDWESLRDDDGAPDPDAISGAIAGADWSDFAPGRDLEPLRELLAELEELAGVTGAHRACTAALRARGARLQHRYGHESPLVDAALSPTGRHLAVGSWVGGDYDRGGTLQIWEVATGRCVSTHEQIAGGVGWPGYARNLQWRGDGRRLGVGCNTNEVAELLPFDDAPGPLTRALVTGGWSRPPAWAWAPEGTRWTIAAWGDSGELPGCIVPCEAGRLGDSDARWFAPTLPEELFDGAPASLEPYTEVHWLSSGRIVGHSTHDQAYAVDADTGALDWYTPVELPVAWDPVGAHFAHAGSGLTLCATDTGESIAELPSIRSISDLVWSPGGRRLAAITDGGAHSSPRVTIVEDGAKLCELGVDAQAPGDAFDFEAGSPWAWSPDGTRGACLTASGIVRIYEIDARPTRAGDFSVPPQSAALLWGDGDILVAVGKETLSFHDVSDGGRTLAHLDLSASFAAHGQLAGLVEDPLRGTERHLGARFALRPSFPLGDRTTDSGWVVAFETGVVVCPEHLVDRLDDELAWVLDRRRAWPWRWGAQNVFPSLAAAREHPDFPLNDREVDQIDLDAPAPAPRPELPLGRGVADLEDLLAAHRASIESAEGKWSYHADDHLREQALYLAERGEIERAFACAERTSPKIARPRTYAELSAIAALEGHPEDARHALRRCEEVLAAEGPGDDVLSIDAARAAAHARLGDRGRADELFERARANLAGEANVGQNHWTLARALLADERLEEATDLMRERFDEAPSFPNRYLSHMIDALVARGEFERARELLEINGGFGDGERRLSYIEALCDARRYGEALDWLDAFARTSDDAGHTRVFERLVSEGETARALAFLEQRLAETASAPRLRAHWITLMADADRARARRLATQLASRTEDLESTHDPGRTFGAVARALLATGCAREARALLEATSSPAARFEVLCALVESDAIEDDAAGRGELDDLYEGAERLVEEATARSALDWMRRLGQAAARAGDAGRRDDYFERATGLSFEGSEDTRLALERTVRARLEVGDFAGAYETWRQINASQRRYSAGSLVEAYTESGEYDAAIHILEQLDPDDMNDRPQKARYAVRIALRGHRLERSEPL